MDLATTLALILLIGAVILAVVSGLAYLIYRNGLRAPALPPPSPSLDVPAPSATSAVPEPTPADGTASETCPAVRPACTRRATGHPVALQEAAFLEYDGETFVPVHPDRLAAPPPGERADAERPASGFAWR
ncbi:hypothetical protein AWN76_016820 [Rhodothermaceae bacterium RA]|nr:hypothetical protein AWN76_016820 [Rhodothermaceae bacterium RA]